MMAVENAASCGQHGLVQWTSCGRLKNLENSRQTLLCSGPRRLYNFSTSENGYHSETTSGVLGETPGSLEEAQGALGTLRGTEATSGQQENSEDLGGNPEEPRSSSGWAGRPVLPGFRQVSWTGGRTYRVWLADCPGSQLAGAIGGVSLLRPGGAPASHTCGGLVFLRAAGQYAVVRVAGSDTLIGRSAFGVQVWVILTGLVARRWCWASPTLTSESAIWMASASATTTFRTPPPRIWP